MSKKLAIKRLTDSDLTFFRWQFENRGRGGNQKAINLNADVLVDRLYPHLPDKVLESDGKVPIDLYLYGPGLAGEYNLQRKIVKLGQYKNWRLNGEFVANPEDDPDRFNSLFSNDFVIFGFEGEVLYPRVIRAVFIASSLPEDARLHTACNEFLYNRSMAEINIRELEMLVRENARQDTHPIHELLLDIVLEDAAQNGITGIRKLTQVSRRRKSVEALQKARVTADRIGRRGEELVNSFFSQMKRKGEILDFEWVSDTNAISPYDFKIITHNGVLFVEVKTTEGDFNNPIHISFNELLQVREAASNYHLYRIYNVTESTAQLKITTEIGGLTEQILEVLEKFPVGVRPDSVSISLNLLSFSEPITIAFVDEDEL